jgi:hypothetical protein
MYCSQCGREAKPGTRFCAGCGAPLGKAKSAPGAVDDISSKVGLPVGVIPEEERAQKTQGTEGMSAEIAAASQLESRAADTAELNATPTKAASATARSEAIETLRQPISKSEIQLSKVPKWIIPLGGVIAIGLLVYLGHSFYESKQELEHISAEGEAQGRKAQQETEARSIAEQQTELERQARQEAATREVETQEKAALRSEVSPTASADTPPL